MPTLRTRHYLWIIGAFVVSWILTHAGINRFDVGGADVVSIVVLFSLTLTFIMKNAITRQNDFKQQVNLELTRLRRVHHLSEAISAPFSRQISTAIRAYLTSIASRSFQEYTDSGEPFRAISHTVYGFKPKTDQAEALYAELLAVTRELSATREMIATLLRSHVSPFGWAVLLIAEVCVIVSYLLTAGVGFVPDIVAWLTITALLLVTALLREVDQLYADELQELSEQYLGNMKRLKEGKR